MSETDAIIDTPAKKTRKRRAAVAAPTLSDDQFGQLLQVIAAGQQRTGGLDADAIRDMLAGVARVTAEHTDRLHDPSNKTHPAISAFSYPEGDRARPKVNPPFAFFYNGYPCSKFMETEHWRECELMADVEPGAYTVVRTDFTKMAVTVTGERDADGKLTKVDVTFPVSREERVLVPPKAVVLYQIVHAGERSPKQLFIEALTEWLSIAGATVDA